MLSLGMYLPKKYKRQVFAPARTDLAGKLISRLAVKTVFLKFS